MLGTDCADVFQNVSFSILFVRNMRGFFFEMYCGKMVKLLVVNLTICEGSPGVFNSQPCLQQFINYSSYFPILAVVPMAISAAELLLGKLQLPAFAYLANLWGSDLPNVLSSFTDPRNLLIF